MPSLLGYALLFTAIGAFFIFIHLMIGRLVRPMRMDAEKATVYECGEPTIGSSWIQFDLRFYVVALLFVVFDVEMAFFFPWAVVFGKSNMLAKTDLPAEERVAGAAELLPPHLWGPRDLSVPNELPKAWQDFERAARETPNPLRTPEQIRAENAKAAGTMSKAIEPNAAERSRDAAEKFSWIAFGDILVFFGVLLVGFAYLWRRGDLDWVRSIAAQKAEIDLEPAVRDQNSEVRSQRSEVGSMTA